VPADVSDSEAVEELSVVGSKLLFVEDGGDLGVDVHIIRANRAQPVPVARRELRSLFFRYGFPI
jgi:hypothetical protein